MGGLGTTQSSSAVSPGRWMRWNGVGGGAGCSCACRAHVVRWAPRRNPRRDIESPLLLPFRLSLERSGALGPRPRKQRSSTSARARPRRGWRALLALVAFVFVLYGNTIPHGYVLDDELVTTRNALVQQGVRGIPRLFATSYLY